MAIFIDTFMSGMDRFKDSMLWVQKVRLWWIKLTLPSKGFILTEIGTKGIKRLRYDFVRVSAADVSEAEFEKVVKAAIGRLNWYAAFAFVVVFLGVVLTAPDFAEQPNLTFGTLKSVIVLVLLVLGYIYRAKRSKVFVGYVLSPQADSKLKGLLHAFTTLSRCSRVWALRVKATDQHWKYNIGVTNQGS